MMEFTKIKELSSMLGNIKIKQVRLNKIARFAVYTLMGLLLSQAVILDEIAPFGIAFTAAISGPGAFFAAAGASMGYIMGFSSVLSVRYICACFSVAAIHKLLETHLQISRSKPYVSAVTSFVCCFFPSLALFLVQGFDSDALAFFTCEGIICAATCVLFRYCASLAREKKSLTCLSVSEFSMLSLSFCILIIPLGLFSIAGFSPARIIALGFLLVLANAKRETGGAVVGICIGITFGLFADLPYLACIYALAGLLCGSFSSINRFASAAALVVCVAMGIIVDISGEAYIALLEAAIAALIFCVIPPKVYKKMLNSISLSDQTPIENDQGEKIIKRLNSASSAIENISDCVEEVQNNLRPNFTIDLDEALVYSKKRVCEQCEIKESCNEKIIEFDSNARQKIINALTDGDPLTPDKFPLGFSNQCMCFEDLTQSFTIAYLNHVAQVGAQGKISEVRHVMTEHFKSMADILKDLACEFDNDLHTNAQANEICMKVSQEFGLIPKKAQSTVDKLGRISIEIISKTPNSRFNVSRLTNALSSGIGVMFALPEIEEIENDTVALHFEQKQMYVVESGTAQTPVDGETLCGDYYEIFKDHQGRLISVLSDGMGTGGRAAVDSALACQMFSRLVKSGLGFDSALKFSNAAMLVKSADETLSTLDVACIDLFSGRTDFMKSGAAASFVRHKGKAAILEQASLPLGILRDAEFSKAAAKLGSGDIILSVSDGLITPRTGWILKELEYWKNGSAEDLAEHILTQCIERNLGKRPDDMTVIVNIIHRTGEKTESF